MNWRKVLQTSNLLQLITKVWFRFHRTTHFNVLYARLRPCKVPVIDCILIINQLLLSLRLKSLPHLAIYHTIQYLIMNTPTNFQINRMIRTWVMRETSLIIHTIPIKQQCLQANLYLTPSYRTTWLLLPVHHMREQRQICQHHVAIAWSSLSFRLVSGFTTIATLYKTWDNMFPLCSAPVVRSWPTYRILLHSNIVKSPSRNHTNLQWKQHGKADGANFISVEDWIHKL